MSNENPLHAYQTVRLMAVLAAAGLGAIGFLIWFSMTYPLGAAGIVGAIAAVAIPVWLHRRKQAAMFNAIADMSAPNPPAGSATQGAADRQAPPLLR